MDWMELAQWLVAAGGSIIVLVALVAGTLDLLLNHPDRSASKGGPP